MPRIDRIEFARLRARRPRHAGSNARLGPHGQELSPPIVRITLTDESFGVGWCRAEETSARRLLGLDIAALFTEGRVDPRWRDFDFPLLDLAGRRAEVPVYELFSRPGADAGITGDLSVPCYDTSLYFDDLHLASDDEACDLMAAEALEGAARGHTAFKIKIGRGAMHMESDAGLTRDVRIVRAVRDAVGPDATIMVDANNGLTARLALRFLRESADAGIYWLEEAFHEDASYYAWLRDRMAAEGLSTLIADGEGDASPRLEEWAARGLIDVIQYDLRDRSFSGWLEIGARLDAAGIRSAPHNYGEPTTNYYAAHLYPAIERFELAEWDEATVEGIAAPGYAIHDGRLTIPASPGFGLELDVDLFRRLVHENGYECT